MMEEGGRKEREGEVEERGEGERERGRGRKERERKGEGEENYANSISFKEKRRHSEHDFLENLIGVVLNVAAIICHKNNVVLSFSFYKYVRNTESSSKYEEKRLF